jgi:mono/diheme cytochrome c family protein
MKIAPFSAQVFFPVRSAVLALMLALVCVARDAGAAQMSGAELFAHYCSYCHGTGDGPGSAQLAKTRGTDKALLLRRTDLAPDYIQYVVRHGLKAMPPFVPSDLTDARLKVLAAYLTSPLPR